MQVLFMTNMPSPYRVDFFNELGKFCNLTVMFERERDYGRDSRYTADKYKNFKAIFPKGIPVSDAEAFCPGVITLLLKKFDQIIVGNYYSPTGMLAIGFMKLMHIPYILSSDGGIVKDDSAFKYKLKKFFIGSASKWLSTGKMTTEYLVYYGAKQDKTFVYPFTSLKESDIVTRPLTKEEKNIIRQELNMTEEKIVISVGQFIYRKGYDVLLKACADLNQDIGVYIIGGTPTKEYLDIKESLHLKHVHFVDFMSKEEIKKYYKAADLFVLPTREDIWGLVINEAMAHGVPVITTDRCVAGLELINNGINGYIVPCDDSIAIAEKIGIYFETSTDHMNNNCLSIIKGYTVENMVREHIKILETTD